MISDHFSEAVDGRFAVRRLTACFLEELAFSFLLSCSLSRSEYLLVREPLEVGKPGPKSSFFGKSACFDTKICFLELLFSSWVSVGTEVFSWSCLIVSDKSSLVILHSRLISKSNNSDRSLNSFLSCSNSTSFWSVPVFSPATEKLRRHALFGLPTRGGFGPFEACISASLLATGIFWLTSGVYSYVLGSMGVVGWTWFPPH